jgi:hypothetical protein
MKNGKTYFLTEVLDSINKGWLDIVAENEGPVSIPYSTRVKLLNSGEKNQKVVILEGYFKGKIGHIPYKSKNRTSFYSFLTPTLRLSYGRKLRLSKDVLCISSKKFQVVMSLGSLKPGIYNIKFPVKTSKKLNGDYLDDNRGGSRFAESWFPVVDKNGCPSEKYIHFGSISEGCITVKYKLHDALCPWYFIYLTLIKSRNGKDNLAKLKVI